MRILRGLKLFLFVLLIMNGAGCTNQTDKDLLQAIQDRKIAEVKQLLDAGVNPNVEDKSGESAIFLAIRAGSLEMIKLLVDHGAKIPKEGYTPLHLAVWEFGGMFYVNDERIKEQKATIEYFLDHGVNVNAIAQETHGAMPNVINGAAMRSDKSVVEILIQRGAKVEPRALFLAAMAGNPDAAEALIEHGIDVNATEFDGATALHHTVMMNNMAFPDLSGNAIKNRIKLIEIFVAGGANINALDKKKYAPLDYAISWGWNSKEIVKALLDNGADPNFNNVLCAARNNPEIIELLLEYGAKNTSGALSSAAYAGNPESVKVLIDHGAEVKKESMFLHSVVAYSGLGYDNSYNQKQIKNRIQLIEFFLSQGVDINTADKEKRTPLHFAVSSGNHDLIKALLDKGADLNAKDSSGKTPIDWAKEKKDKPEILKLLKQFAAKDKDWK